MSNILLTEKAFSFANKNVKKEKEKPHTHNKIKAPNKSFRRTLPNILTSSKPEVL